MVNYDIKFKKINEDDLALLHQWFQIPHVLKWYARDEKYTFKMIQEKYLPRINDETIQSFVIYDDDKPVGYIQLYHVNNHLPEGIKDYHHPLFDDFKPHELAGIDFFIADDEYLRIGFSSKALKAFIDTNIKNKFKAILVDPSNNNIIAIKFFEKNSYKSISSQDDHHELMFNDIRGEK